MVRERRRGYYHLTTIAKCHVQYNILFNNTFSAFLYDSIPSLPSTNRAEQPLHVRPLHRARAEQEVCSARFGEEGEPSRAERSFKMFGSARLGSASPLLF